eukprot:gene2728-3923_t
MEERKLSIITITEEKHFEVALNFLFKNFKKEHPELKEINDTILGFDLEFFEKKVATIQLSTNKLCLIFQVYNIKELPKFLVSYLTSDKHLKCGVGISGGGGQGDDIMLKNTFGIEMKGCFDVGEVAYKKGITTNYRSLDDLSSNILGVGKIIRISNTFGKKENWSNDVLSIEQIEYAAIDAWLGYNLVIELYKSLGQLHGSILEWANSIDFSSFDVSKYKGFKEPKNKQQKILAREMEWKKLNGHFQKKLNEKKALLDYKKRKYDEIDDLVSNLKNKKKEKINDQKEEEVTSSIQFNFM